ncbi:MAG: hypothetical protein MJ016_05775 [Victivallaceae bacterium]|nr:hypothetical protein [Victivallaceae bacterium]
MKKTDLDIDRSAREVVATLQSAGFESYIVGGAIRDLLLGRTPKDFDVATAATPEEVRTLFGRRSCRIIGKRFRLAHVFRGEQLFEVSTFRRAPAHTGAAERPGALRGAPNDRLIVSDNDFGTAPEDAFRRDFTVNALFYDPIGEKLVDYTGHGIADIEKKIVRSIGDPALRFAEDPVRMLRALKLVAQYDFELDNATENALFSNLKLLSCAAPSRLSLELEKILLSSYGDRHLEVFYDYGLLKYLLPRLSRQWGTPERERALALLFERNCRVEERRYRNSISLAAALLTLPFAEKRLTDKGGGLYPATSDAAVIGEELVALFSPLNLIARLKDSALRILTLLPKLFASKGNGREWMRHRAYAHAREAAIIVAVVAGENPEAAARRWLPVEEPLPRVKRKRPPRKRRSSGEKR